MTRARALAAALLVVAGGTAAALPDTGGAVRRGYADAQSGQVHYRYTAPAATARARAPVALFHLSPNSGQVFSALLPLLGRDRVAVAFDTPGYGMSDPVPDPQTIGAYAERLASAMSALGLDSGVDLVGYHTGAAIALELAQRYPAQAGRLALVAVPVLTAEERAAGAALPAIPFDEAGEWAKQEWQRSWRWRGPGQDRESVLATFAEKLRPGARERGATAVLAYDTAAALERVTAPLLLVRPRDDLWTATGRARALRPDARWVELPGYGHGLFHAAPQRMDGILRDFLDPAD